MNVDQFEIGNLRAFYHDLLKGFDSVKCHDLLLVLGRHMSYVDCKGTSPVPSTHAVNCLPFHMKCMPSVLLLSLFCLAL